MIKKILKSILPPFIPNCYFWLKNRKYGWTGSYHNWDEALSHTTTYSDNEIYTKVISSARRVFSGEYPYERDGVLFSKVDYSWPLLSGLLFSAAKNSSLTVLDFGGGMGSSYFQNLAFIRRVKSYSWAVVEQKKFYEIAKKDFTLEYLSFYNDINTCIEATNPNTLLLSSVLQYLERPFEILDKLLHHKFSTIIIDRTPITKDREDVIKIQNVSPEIYSASYPCWFFSESLLYTYFRNKNYKIIEEFDTSPGKPFKGLILEHNYEK